MGSEMCIRDREMAALSGRSISFMAKWDMNDAGSSCHIHSSLWSMDGSTALFANPDHDGHGEHGHSSHGAERHHDSAAGMSTLFKHYLAGLIATSQEFALLWAPTINSYKRFQPNSWAPTGIAWGHDNRTLGYRLVGHGKGTRVECRIPGSDANSYLAFAGILAGGLYGIRHELELGAPFEGNGYEATEIPRIPWNICDAIDLWEQSTIAKECFGDDVHHHILTAAKGEWAAFNQAVTDWELRRYWERA